MSCTLVDGHSPARDRRTMIADHRRSLPADQVEVRRDLLADQEVVLHIRPADPEVVRRSLRLHLAEEVARRILHRRRTAAVVRILPVDQEEVLHNLHLLHRLRKSIGSTLSRSLLMLCSTDGERKVERSTWCLNRMPVDDGGGTVRMRSNTGKP